MTYLSQPDLASFDLRPFTSDKVDHVKFGSPHSTSSSTCSDANSDTSVSSDNESTTSSDTDSCESDCPSFGKPAVSALQSIVPPEQRKNPRRTAPGARGGHAQAPPKLCRQSERKVNFVDNLVGTATRMVQAIWPLSSSTGRSDETKNPCLSLGIFIQETLRRSRTSYSTLQVALYYLILVKSSIPARDFTKEQSAGSLEEFALQDGRRMFLAALILASKYLQDRNYSAKAWSKISGLNTLEINRNEIAFLKAVDWKIHIADDIFKRWTEVMRKHAPPVQSQDATLLERMQLQKWESLILRLKPDLTNADQQDEYPTPSASPDLHVPTAYSNPCALRSILNETDESACTPTTYQAPKLGRPSMASAMSEATLQANKRFLDCRLTTGKSMPVPSPQRPALRRSSLARSVSSVSSASSASSPESMVSDSSRYSRRSSVSSTSTYPVAMPSLRAGMSVSVDGRGFREPCVVEDPAEGEMVNLYDQGYADGSLDKTATLHAAETLQGLRHRGSKRDLNARNMEEEQLQTNVRGLLNQSTETSWLETMVGNQSSNDRKRVCRPAVTASRLLHRESTSQLHQFY